MTMKTDAEIGRVMMAWPNVECRTKSGDWEKTGTSYDLQTDTTEVAKYVVFKV